MVEIMKIVNIGLMADFDYALALEFEDGSWELFEDYINKHVEKKFKELSEKQNHE
jgi:N12 class adenine-specific DNA methylase